MNIINSPVPGILQAKVVPETPAARDGSGIRVVDLNIRAMMESDEDRSVIAHEFLKIVRQLKPDLIVTKYGHEMIPAQVSWLGGSEYFCVAQDEEQPDGSAKIMFDPPTRRYLNRLQQQLDHDPVIVVLDDLCDSGASAAGIILAIRDLNPPSSPEVNDNPKSHFIVRDAVFITTTKGNAGEAVLSSLGVNVSTLSVFDPYAMTFGPGFTPHPLEERVVDAFQDAAVLAQSPIPETAAHTPGASDSPSTVSRSAHITDGIVVTKVDDPRKVNGPAAEEISNPVSPVATGSPEIAPTQPVVPWRQFAGWWHRNIGVRVSIVGRNGRSGPGS